VPRAVVRIPATHFPCASGADIRIPLYTSFIASHALCLERQREIFMIAVR
jgi:hypothetical protein